MSAFTDYMEGNILNWLRGTSFPAAPGSMYLALFTASPTDSGDTTNELTALNSPGYSRVQVLASNWSVPTTGSGASSIQNQNAIEFPEATGNWAGPITHFALMTAPSGGQMLLHGALTTPRTIGTGDVLRYSAGALVINVA